MQKGHSDQTTQGIRVRVAAQFVPERSDPDRRHWFYVYKVVLTNVGEVPARLVSRHWVIRDAENRQREVRGPGVVGEQPEIQPGETYSYMSSCPLETEWGTMEGSYHMVRPDGSAFDARIGRFFLAPTAAGIAALDLN
ncbi:MAG: Co2+/Mg2+ efflux protein ApaG [Planctomycetes bacterium]|nr:Co2+/Mg2+ efflux protein ApaG [Planctomycetota bacterium]